MNKLLFIVGSTNQIKIDTVGNAVENFFPGSRVSGKNVSSEVAAQPLSDLETKVGAINRAKNCLLEDSNADFGIGIESGIELRTDGLWAIGWIAIINRNQKLGLAKTTEFRLPDSLIPHIQSGMELSQADALVFGRADSGEHEGTVGLLTRGKITRSEVIYQAVVFALLPFLNGNHYK